MTEQKSFVVSLEKHFYQLDHHKSERNIKKGAYISHSLDSMEDDTVWHRCKIDCIIPPDTSVYVTYFASNYNTVLYQGQEQELDKIISSTQIDSREKEALLAGFWQEEVINGVDFPLHKAKGRFLWYKVEFVSYSGEYPSITDIKIDFPLKPITDYLPEIYQQDKESYDLLNRFLGIFQSMIDDLDYSIKDVSSYLDVEIVNKEFLQWLCQWLDIDNYYIWTEKKLRKMLGMAYQLYQIKGTKKSIEIAVEIYTGETPFIVENFEIEDYQASLYNNLYGDNNYTFTVMVKEELMPTPQHYLELKQLIDSFKPAYTLLNLVVLRSAMFLDSYVYLGVNSVLSSSNNLILDDKATIPFDTTIEGMEDYR